MSRYFFDIFDGDDLAIDETGLECISIEKMRLEALTILPDIARDELPYGERCETWVKVRDDQGRSVFEASLILTTKWTKA